METAERTCCVTVKMDNSATDTDLISLQASTSVISHQHTIVFTHVTSESFNDTIMFITIFILFY